MLYRALFTNNTGVPTSYQNYSFKRRKSSKSCKRPLTANNAINYALFWSVAAVTGTYSFYVRNAQSYLLRRYDENKESGD